MTGAYQTLSAAFDAHAPAQIAQRIESGGVAKANLSALKTATLGNIVGGSGLVALIYWLVYPRDDEAARARGSGLN